MITLTTGTALIMWLGEQISEKGIGNGISLIIFAGIVVRLPSAIVVLLHPDLHRRAQALRVPGPDPHDAGASPRRWW